MIPIVHYLCPGEVYFVTLISRSMAEIGFLSVSSDLHCSVLKYNTENYIS